VRPLCALCVTLLLHPRRRFRLNSAAFGLNIRFLFGVLAPLET
jgi:hypothetical protein